jgi:hypothetical protein
MLNFQLSISTKPNVVKYSTSGSVVMTGKPDDIKKKLEVNPKTKIPQILFTIYQHVFNSIYILSSNLNTPYPPPDLLHPMAEKIQIISNNTPSQASAAENTEKPPASPTGAPAQPSAPVAAPTQSTTPSTQPSGAPAPSASTAQPASPTSTQPEAPKQP